MANKVNRGIIPEEAAAVYSTIPAGAKILNAIRSEASQQYKDRIPVATQNNINEIGNPILNYENLQKEFVQGLITRISMTIITSRSYNNPLREFKRTLPVGTTVQEIFVNIIKSEPYYEVDDLGMTDCEDLFKRRLPEYLQAFHERNRRDKYPITISDDDLRAAFMSYEGVEDLVSRTIESVYTSDAYDEFLLMKNILNEAGNRGAFYPITIPDPTDDATARSAMVAIRQGATDLTFMSDRYNLMGVTTHTPIEDQIIFILSRFNAITDVEVLAKAFNMSRSDFIGRVIVVDDFGGLEKEGAVAIVTDRDWFMVFDTLFGMREAYNGARLYWNYFLHHQQILSYSPFKNGIVYTTVSPSVSTVTVTPATVTITKGVDTTQQFTATVNGAGIYNPNVTWTATGNDGVKYNVTREGLLTVPANSTSASITVTAASKQDTSKTASGVVTLSPASRINGVVVEPQTATISKTTGGTQQFNSTVSGTGNYSQTVTWNVSGDVTSGATVSSTGLLTVPPNDPATKMYVYAVSNQDSSKTAMATVTLS